MITRRSKHELARARDPRSSLLLSLGMGVTYLAYDFAPVFLPATVLLMLCQRRWRELPGCVLVQALPLLLWLGLLAGVFRVPLANSNTAAYGAIFQTYLQVDDFATWAAGRREIVDLACYVFLGSNFLFLPALFLVVLALDRLAGRGPLPLAELAILGTALLLFLFNNLAPEYRGAWPMRGSWISRLYQPVFPVMVFAIARWWQHLAGAGRLRRTLLALPLVAAGAGNTLVLFGPILRNPGRVSEEAFFQFYSHSDFGAVLRYGPNLVHYGLHPLGFPTRPADSPAR